MLFNSWLFLFCFLPVFLLAWQFATTGEKDSGKNAAWTLLGASAIFYALWGLAFFVLLAAMICMNYAFGLYLAPTGQEKEQNSGARRKIFILALVLNLLPLLWFKYSWFIIRNVALLFDLNFHFTPPELPLGISFYTFIQIAWLTGVYKGDFPPAPLLRHSIFSASFPWVISGPIVRYEQIGSQLATLAPLQANGLARGFSLFSIGLAKKVILADSIGFYADAIFNAAEKGWPISGLEGWLGSLCYTFQLYFDFSGYTDMALGLGLMVGLQLPENFNSPYKSTGIVDFWRRWHITLSAWLRDFLYIPMGGNRHGKVKQYRNLFLTMLIGGAWHGAGWTFIIWGALHGFMLGINHFFRALIKGSAFEKLCKTLPLKLLFIIFTFFCLDFCWVVFRALSLDGALAIYRAMFTGPWLAAPESGALLQALLPNNYFNGWQGLALVALCWALCWFTPNSGQIMRGESAISWLAWRPRKAWAAFMALLAFASLLLLSRHSAFLYFQF